MVYLTELTEGIHSDGVIISSRKVTLLMDLPKSNLHHTIQIGMLDHLQKGIFHYMMTHKWLHKYIESWLSVPTYHDLTPINKSYEDLSPLN
jgi:hypothetical protein